MRWTIAPVTSAATPRWLSTLKGEVMSIDTLFFVLLLAMCGIAGYLVIPRVMRKWSVATKPADERLEYSAHMGQESIVDRPRRLRRSASALATASSKTPRFASCKLQHR